MQELRLILLSSLRRCYKLGQNSWLVEDNKVKTNKCYYFLPIFSLVVAVLLLQLSKFIACSLIESRQIDLFQLNSPFCLLELKFSKEDDAGKGKINSFPLPLLLLLVRVSVYTLSPSFGRFHAHLIFHFYFTLSVLRKKYSWIQGICTNAWYFYFHYIYECFG